MAQPFLRTEKMTRVLQAEELSITLVNEADVNIFPGEFVAITGPSGSGKSSLLYLLGLLDRPTRGHLWLDGQDMSAASEHERARMRLAKLGFVFQFHFLLPEFSALENVMLPMQKLGVESLAACRERAAGLLEQLGLKDQMQKLPRQLSGGQSQRVAIARALANRPRMLLADEPTGNLDSVSGAKVKEIFRSLVRNEKCAIAMVTHDENLAAQADRTIHIVDGKIQKAEKARN